MSAVRPAAAATTPSRRLVRVWSCCLALAMLPWVLLPGAGSSAQAAFGDSAGAQASFGTATIARPGSPTCSIVLGLLVANAGWTAVPGATAYLISVNGTAEVSYPPSTTSWNAVLSVNTVVTVRTQRGTWTSLPVTYSFPTLGACTVT